MRLLGTLLFSCILLCCAPLQAHQMKSAITKLHFNDRSGQLEVMHRFYLHDAEHAVKQLQGKAADIHQQEASRAKFASYVAAHFSLKLNGEVLPLTLLGSELDGRHIWVYQEVALPDNNLQSLTVRHDSLMKIWPAQINVVNLEGRGPVRTLKLSRQEPEQTLRFASPVKS
ncbi:MAG: DUF6702 family protein [Rheinheimera sp.]